MTEVERSYFEWCKEKYLSGQQVYIDDMPEAFERHIYMYRNSDTEEIEYGVSEHPLDWACALSEIEDA